MLLNIVTNEELLTSQIVKTILLFLLAGGIIYNVIRIFRSNSKTKRIINSVILVILSVILVFVIKEYRIESGLLKSPEFVQGTTIDYCTVFAEGKGIEFEYQVDGKKYRNCNTFHPIPTDSIVVPGGVYMVRYSKNFPDEGRMDFSKRVK